MTGYLRQLQPRYIDIPLRGLDPRIHVFHISPYQKTWMPGQSPATGI